MSNLILYGIAFIFCVMPFFVKGLNFIDIIPLFLFYFDATFVFAAHAPTYQYFQSFIIIFFSIKLLAKHINNGQLNSFGVLLYIVIALFVFPIFQGESVEPTLRTFSVACTSLILLPVSFFHYYETGNIKNLLRATFVLLVVYVLFILIATPLSLGGIESERYGGSTFYFGHVASRGGITYIAFVMLMAPLIYTTLKTWQKILLLIVIGFIMIIFLTVLKRFVFAIIGLGVLNYMLRPIIKPKFKISIAIVTLIISGFVLSQATLSKVISERYDQRGGESKFSQDNVKTDIRFYEPYYVFLAMMDKPFINVLIGKKKENVLELKHEDNVYEERKIHNSYANSLLSVGVIGLLMYLAIYYKFYNKVKLFYRSLTKTAQTDLLPYWIVFQNLVIIFLLQGIIGGHDRVSLRGLVFLYAGAVGGYIYHKRVKA